MEGPEADAQDPAKDPYFEGLREHRKQLLDLMSDQLKEFDKAILWVCSGALGLSITFVDKFSGHPLHLTVWLLLSWGCFALAIVLNIVSYLTGAKDAVTEIEKVDDCLREAKDYEISGNVFKAVTVMLNVSALVLFMGGICLLMRHAYLSMSG